MGNTEGLLFSPFKKHFKIVNKYSYSLQINLIYLPSNYGKINSMKEKLLLTIRYPFKIFMRIHSVSVTILGIIRDTMPRKLTSRSSQNF